jgi:hypothetical protein
MRFQVSAIGLACITLLSACGGGNDAAPGSGSMLQSINFPFPGTRYLGAAPAPLTATSNSGLPITFASNTPANCTVVDGKLVPLKEGECSLTASQAGDSTWAPATGTQQLIKINKSAQEITFTSPGFQAIDGTPPALVATADSGLAVRFESNSPEVCTVNGTTLTLVSKGTCSISAYQDGTDKFSAAPKASVSFVVDDAPPPVLTFASGYQTNNLIMNGTTIEGGMTKEGGKFNIFAGSNMDGWYCWNRNPAPWCSASVSADGTSVKVSYLIQPATLAVPNTDGWLGAYVGLQVFAPGLSGFNSSGDTLEGVKVGKQKTIKINLAQNADWFGNTPHALKVHLQLGHYAKKGNDNCNVSLMKIFTPTAAGPTTYELPLDSFDRVSESCNLVDLVPATELAAYPIVLVKVEAENANTSTSLTTPATYNNEITLTGAITIQ